MYSSQSESIREDIPVLQRLCPATIFQKPLMKMLNSLILYCIFMYTISSVYNKIWATASAIFASVQLYSSCAVGVVRAFCGRWWTSVHLCDSLHEPQKRGRINSNRFIEIHRFFFFLLKFYMEYKGANWEATAFIFFHMTHCSMLLYPGAVCTVRQSEGGKKTCL